VIFIVCVSGWHILRCHEIVIIRNSSQSEIKLFVLKVKGVISILDVVTDIFCIFV